MLQKRSLCYKLASLTLICGLLAVLLPPIRVDAAGDRIIRVGLCFGSSAVPTANLANEEGSGYQFGTFSEDGAFTPLGSTTREKITICKDENFYFSGGSFYETPTAGSSILIGAYHLQDTGSYSGFEEAQAAAARYPYGFPAWVNGSYVARFEFYSTENNAAAAQSGFPNARAVGGSSSCYTVVDTETGEILFEFDGGSDSYLGVMPSGTGELTQTWFKGYQYYGGFEYMRRSGNDLTVVNRVSEDLYVAGVLPYEFVVSGDLESLKAGAIAIRTFARATSKHSASGFEICNTTDCQVYRGVYTKDYAGNVLQAVRETSGLCAYYDGKPIQALYSSSDGGATEDAVNAWGVEYPYLKGKTDPYESTITFGGQNWSYHVSADDLQSLMNTRGYNCGTVTGFAVTQVTPNGNVNEITITDSAGKTLKFSKDNVRILQSLPGVTYMSRRFTIQSNSGGTSGGTGPAVFSVYDGSTTSTASSVTAITANGKVSISAPASVLTDSGLVTIQGGDVPITAPVQTGGYGSGWTITGGGYGHNIGLSQWGAYAMGKQGFTYDEILKFYYTGITIE